MNENNYAMIKDGELKHYGVLGMKWGVRRAQKKGTTYAYKSHATKVYEKKADKAHKKGNTAKANKYDNFSKRSADLDRKMQKMAENTSVGKAIAQNLLLWNNRTYMSTKAATGNDPVVSRAAGWVNQYMLGGLGDMPIRAAYVRGMFDKD
jgi:hypothetical protein